MPNSEKDERALLNLAKVVLFVSNVIVFGSVIGIMIALKYWWPKALIGAVFLTAANVFVAAVAVKTAESLSRWSFPDSRKQWQVSTRLFSGAVWPGTLIFWLVIAPFNRIVRALYQ